MLESILWLPSQKLKHFDGRELLLKFTLYRMNKTSNIAFLSAIFMCLGWALIQISSKFLKNLCDLPNHIVCKDVKSVPVAAFGHWTPALLVYCQPMNICTLNSALNTVVHTTHCLVKFTIYTDQWSSLHTAQCISHSTLHIVVPEKCSSHYSLQRVVQPSHFRAGCNK